MVSVQCDFSVNSVSKNVHEGLGMKCDEMKNKAANAGVLKALKNWYN